MDYKNTNPYTQQDYNFNNQMPSIHNPGQTLATVSMILGIASIFTLFTVYIPLICGSIAIVLAILSKGYGKKMLTAARVGIGTAVGGILLIVTIVGSLTALILSSGSDVLIKFGQQMDQQFLEQTGQEFKDIFGASYEDIMKNYARELER